MSGRTFAALAAGAVMVVAACSSSGGTPSSSGSVCAGTTDPGAIAVEIRDFEFAPATITAKPGQVIAFTNTGFEHHNATLDAGGCATRSLGTGDRDGLAFTTTGRYPFHCTVHPWMTGTITVAA